MQVKPVAIDLCCGLGGWAEGLLAEGYEVIGYDTEAHDYGTGGYPGRFIIADITTLHGSIFKDAALIVASPPCQKYSYMAMPWSLGKAKAAAIEADVTGELRRELNLLFDTCFRLQREACEAAGHHIPMIVENVRGAQKWVGQAKWNYGSFYLWGDVSALMPTTIAGRKIENVNNLPRVEGQISPQWRAKATQHLTGIKGMGIGSKSWHQGKGQRSPNDPRNFYSKDIRRKLASAMIAKIPFPLSQHIARTFYPVHEIPMVPPANSALLEASRG